MGRRRETLPGRNVVGGNDCFPGQHPGAVIKIDKLVFPGINDWLAPLAQRAHLDLQSDLLDRSVGDARRFPFVSVGGARKAGKLCDHRAGARPLCLFRGGSVDDFSIIEF